jgi:exosortase
MIKTRGRSWRVFALVAAIALLALIYWPSLRWMVNSWISSDYYSHGFLVPLISGFFIWTRRKQLTDTEPSVFGYGVIFLALVLYVLSFMWEIRELNALSLVFVIFGLVISMWGLKTFKTLVFPLVFLLFMIPFSFIQDLAYSLQFLSVHWASAITKFLGLPIVTSGTEIHLGEITFTVGIVCSGINTLVALLALSAVYAFILKGSVPKRLGLFLLAFPIAIGANILRISSIILVAYWTNVEIASGWYHDISSPLFFFIAFGVLIFIGWLMKFRINYDIFGQK